MFGKLLGVVYVIFGLAIGGWVAYNLLVEMQPAAEGKNPLFAIGISLIFLYGAYQRLRPVKTEPLDNEINT